MNVDAGIVVRSKNIAPVIQGVTRIAVGLMFWSHGAQKLLGWFGGLGPQGGAVDLASSFGVAGIVEFSTGILITVGLFTRPAAFIAFVEMIIAYSWMHVASGAFLDTANEGEAVLLYAFIFLFYAFAGAGVPSFDRLRGRRRGRHG